MGEKVARQTFSRSSASYVYLGSMLRRQTELGLDSRIADAVIEDYNQVGPAGFAATISIEDPVLVGTTPFELNIGPVKGLFDFVRLTKPGTICAIGGPFATRVPKSALRMTGADVAFRGEADFTFRQAMERLRRGQTLEDLMGIDGVVVRSGDRILYGTESERVPVITQPDYRAIAIKYDLLADVQARAKYLSLDFVFSRGCPNQTCSFCDFFVGDNTYRRLQEDKVMEIMHELKRLKAGALSLCFGDAIFGGGRQQAKSLLRRIIAEGPFFIRYHGEFSVDQFLVGKEVGNREVDRELLDLVREASFFCETGIDHLSSEGLAQYGKGSRYTVEEAMNLARQAQVNGASLGVNYLHIPPGISVDGLVEHYSNVIKLRDELGSDGPVELGHSTLINPYIGTGEYERIIKRMEEDEVYGELMAPLVQELPEDDEYGVIFPSHYMPFDPFLCEVLIEYKIYCELAQSMFDLPLNTDRAYIHEVFGLLEIIKHKTDDRAIKERIDGIHLSDPDLISLRDDVRGLVDKVYSLIDHFTLMRPALDSP